ncbi:MAG: UDP-N-acetylmuramoyl-L-alanyl-D-glutamate--2,6-diaminopimelate ligase [Tannerella sp.]|jgi:UDP-N-acetylmuramoyl-L-alanyl-D-glutamate--2,6-diaminopimelate ligase|nr:UDP-N-acetylmuramoyl-L-alanyl-D-glutamate--2,6-diaminopimelate ligase [Tannerella sp.]
MKLFKLINIAGLGSISGKNDPEITGVQSDSRLVEPGALFVAVKGTAVDGHDYIGKAIEKGAVAIVCEQTFDAVTAMPGEQTPAAAREEKDITFITVPDSADALGHIASAWYGEPSSQMTVIGVTGTNGKTTIATLLYQLFRKLGYKAGLLSTVCNYIDGEAIPASHTTPDPLTLNRLMAEMADAGCEYVFMEVSSHSCAQKRISGLDFNGGIFTNLTRDHLDYHLTVENYLKAKKKFFDDLPASAFALTNADDKTGTVMLQNTPARKLTYALRTPADFKGKIIEAHFDGMEIHINGRDVYTHFTGRFNASNLLAVYGAAVALGEEPEAILIALSTLRPVSGRFETIGSPQGFTAIVDYAHTPDALENVLNGIREVLNGDGRVITVVGAGGNRDKGKRPLMAKEAVRQSNLLILTSDNPRFEEPDEIINDMTAGLNASEKERTLCIADRRQAVKTAVTLAGKGDIILVAGKGHEDYQEINGVKYPFDDRKILRELFKTDN